MGGLSLGTRLPNLKFVPSAVLELLAFNAPKSTGSRDRDHAHFSERLSVGTRLPNLNFLPSAVLEQTDRQTDRREQAYERRQRG